MGYNCYVQGKYYPPKADSIEVLQGERMNAVLITYSVLLMLHVIGVYWWYQNNDLLYPLVMLPPKTTTFLAHDIHHSGTWKDKGFSALSAPCALDNTGLVSVLLKQDYGSLFSSLTTLLYLTFKLTSVFEKVQSFCVALKAFSQKEVHYGSYATLEQVNEAGDLCAICQERMQASILLRCKHIFCEVCVSEWFERERTCPLCRAVVKAADLPSFGNGSTSLFFQLF